MQAYFQSWWDHFQSNNLTEEALLGPLSFTQNHRSLSLESQTIILGYITGLLLKKYPKEKVPEALALCSGLKHEFVNNFFSRYCEKNIAVPEFSTYQDFIADNHKIYSFSKIFSNQYLYGEKAAVNLGTNFSLLLHPADKSSQDDLKAIPFFDGLIKTFHEIYDDKIIKVENLGKYIHVTPKQYPDLYYLLKETCEILGLKKEPDLYLCLGHINAYTTSITDPCIVLSSGVLQLCNRDEIMFILAHEIGHIMCEHLLYTQMSSLLPKILASAGKMTFGATSLMSVGLEVKFRSWSRAAEFTADRFGFLACQNLGASITTLMKLAGAPPTMINQFDINEYLKQFDEYTNFQNSGLNKAAAFMGKLDESHPYGILRVKHLIDFAVKVKTGSKQAA